MLEAVLNKRKKIIAFCYFYLRLNEIFTLIKICLKEKEDKLRFSSRNEIEVNIKMKFIESEISKVLLFI